MRVGITRTVLAAAMVTSAIATAGPAAADTVPGGGVQIINTGAANTTVFGNVTVTGTHGPGHLVLYTCGTSRPGVSNLNWTQPNATIANFAAVRSNNSGQICAYTSVAAHVLFDRVATDASINAATPARILDTRLSPGERLGAGKVQVIATGQANSTVFGNVTVAAPTSGGHVVLFPCGTPKPIASNLNWTRANTTIAAFAAVRTGGSGEICAYSSAATHLIFDRIASTRAITSQSPIRVLDTRVSPGARVPAAGVQTIRTGSANTTVLGTLTSTGTTGSGHAVLFTCGTSRPPVSNLNWTQANTTIANFAAVRTNGGGEICVYASSPAHFVFDRVATTNVINAAAPTRRIDTRPPALTVAAVRNAPAPAGMCWHPAGRFVNGGRYFGYGDQAGEHRGEESMSQIALGPIRVGEVLVPGSAAVSIFCNAGGVDWPDYVIAYLPSDQGPQILAMTQQPLTPRTDRGFINDLTITDGKLTWNQSAMSGCCFELQYASVVARISSDRKIVFERVTWGPIRNQRG